MTLGLAVNELSASAEPSRLVADDGLSMLPRPVPRLLTTPCPCDKMKGLARGVDLDEQLSAVI